MGGGGSNTKKTIPEEEWRRRLEEVEIKKSDLNRLVMDFLVTEGYLDAARSFSKESGTPPTANLDTITERMHIRRALQSGKVEDAVERVNEMDPEILENPALAFSMQKQQLIELIRGGKLEEALEYAAEYLAPQGEENPILLSDLEQTMALLVFNNPDTSPLGNLLSAEQRQKTAGDLNQAILNKQGQQSYSKLPGLLRLLVWAQKALAEKANYPMIEDLAGGILAIGTTK